jgi:hypothetical protein
MFRVFFHAHRAKSFGAVRLPGTLHEFGGMLFLGGGLFAGDFLRHSPGAYRRSERSNHGRELLGGRLHQFGPAVTVGN